MLLKHFIKASVLRATLAASPRIFAATPDQPELIVNPDFENRAPASQLPSAYELSGNAAYHYLGDLHKDFSSMGVALDSGPQANAAAEISGCVSQSVKYLDGKAGRWFRFSFRGLPQDNFAVKDGGLFMKAEFFNTAGKSFFDGVTRNLFEQLEKERRELSENGDFRHGGAAAWRSYQFDFKLPFAEVDEVRLSVGFRGGCANTKLNAAFFVDDFSLVRIPDPISEEAPKPVTPARVQGLLLPLGGKWFYDAREGEKEAPKVFNAANASRLFYQAGDLQTPFAGNMSAWLKAGFKDEHGLVVTQPRFVEDSVTLSFTATHLIMHAKNLPNHPTARFPEEGVGPHNPSFIQEHNYTYYLPLNPELNPGHIAMNAANTNLALHMGAIGVAVNGVVFYNPFDAGGMDASNLMDRCCGHPSPDNRYHYHKYPICVKSPWADEGTAHSPLIGWAFDGFPIYGPYEAAGLMAKDAKGAQALDAFNAHYDAERGWHYHATPGKYPYLIGGFLGAEDPRNAPLRPPGGGPGGPGGPGRGPPPPRL